jgi:hypothetical protein
MKVSETVTVALTRGMGTETRELTATVNRKSSRNPKSRRWTGRLNAE